MVFNQNLVVRKLLLFALLVSLTVVTDSSASYAGTISQASGSAYHAGTNVGQTFTMPANMAGQLTSISNLYIAFRGPTGLGTVQCKIYTSAAKTTLLATSTNTIADNVTDNDNFQGVTGSFSFNNVSLSANTQYYFEVSVYNSSSAYAFYLYEQYNGTYAGGNSYFDGYSYSNYDIRFTVNYTDVAVDITPPTFTSTETFTVSENSQQVGNLQSSESSTISIQSGLDASFFNLNRISETSSSISFVAAPDFENPLDANADNTYLVVVKAVDGALNIGYETLTVIVADVIDSTSFNSFSTQGNLRVTTYRTPIQLTVNMSTPSKVTFFANSKRIGGCVSITTTGTSPNITAVCTWRPSVRGAVSIYASAVPNGLSVRTLSSTIEVLISNRTTRR